MVSRFASHTTLAPAEPEKSGNLIFFVTRSSFMAALSRRRKRRGCR